MEKDLTTQADDDFEIIDLIRELPTVVVYAALASSVPGSTRDDLFDALHAWKARNGQVVS